MVEQNQSQGLDYLTQLGNNPTTPENILPAVDYDHNSYHINFVDPINKVEVNIAVQNEKLTSERYGMIVYSNANSLKQVDNREVLSVKLLWDTDDFNTVATVFSLSHLKLLMSTLKARIVCAEAGAEDTNYAVGFMPFAAHTFVCRWRSMPNRNIVSMDEQFTDLFGHHNCNHEKAEAIVNMFASACDIKENVDAPQQLIDEARGLTACDNFEVGVSGVYEHNGSFYAELMTVTGPRPFAITTSDPDNLYNTSAYEATLPIEEIPQEAVAIVRVRTQSKSLINNVHS